MSPWKPIVSLHYQTHYNNRIQNKNTIALHVCKIHHKVSLVSSLNNTCTQPESALTHLSEFI